MLRYQKIYASEGIGVNKTSASKECELCYYLFLKDIWFKFEEHVCNKCDDLLTMAHSLGATFRCIWCISDFLMGISKCEVLKRFNNPVTYGRGVL